MWNGKTADGVHLFDTSVPPGENLVSASRVVLATSAYLAGVPANSSDFVCDSDPFLSANWPTSCAAAMSIPRGREQCSEPVDRLGEGYPPE